MNYYNIVNSNSQFDHEARTNTQRYIIKLS